MVTSKSRTVQFSQNAPAVKHTAVPNQHRTFEAWNVFVFCGQGTSCRKMCAHKTDIVVVKKAQTEVNHHLRAEDSRIQSNAWQHSRQHPHLTLFIERQVTLFSAECFVPITARKKKKKSHNNMETGTPCSRSTFNLASVLCAEIGTFCTMCTVQAMLLA